MKEKKCLNCGKSVQNKYCGTRCQNQHRRTLNEEKYNKNPKRCLLCGNIIKYDLRVNSFCSSSCSATYNNKRRKDVGTGVLNYVSLISDEDFISCIKSSGSYREVAMKIGYASESTHANKIIRERAKALGIIIDFKKNSIVDLYVTKGALFSSSKNWQSARSSLRRHAVRVYIESGRDLCCYKCGYDKHVQVAHIKGVAEFGNNCKIEDINSIDNLVALCPNCHWEYDNGLLKI